MRRIVLYFLMFGIMMVSGIQAHAQPVFNDYQLEQQGFLQFLYGYNSVSGNAASYQTVFNQSIGPITDYNINLAGRLFDQWTHLSYSFLKNPGEKLDWTMNFQNKWVHATYDHSVNIKFPQIRLGFGDNRIDGFLFETNQPGATLFSGTENYIPVTTNRMVTPAGGKILLFDVPPSFADVVEGSEFLILNGQHLERNLDYTINYLRGEVELLVPVTVNSSLEAKFLMIPTNEEETDDPGQLYGSVFSKSWDANLVSVYYLERHQKVAPAYVEPQPGESGEPILDPGEPIDPTDPGSPPPPRRNLLMGEEDTGSIQIQQVKGVVAQINQGPIAFDGEVAVSSQPGAAPVTAYDIDFQLTDEKLDLSYEMREIPVEFQEVGVNKVMAGNSHKLKILQRAEEDIHLGIEVSNFIKEKDHKIYETNTKQGEVKVFATPNQYGQLIVVDTNQELTDLQEPDKSGSKRTADLLVGYTYETRPLTFSVQQSIQDADQRSVYLKAKQAGFYFSGDYKLQELWEYQMHQSQIVCSYDPVPAFGINSIIDYEQPKGIDQANIRLNLSSNWIPVPAFQVNGGYVYFRNVDYKQLEFPQSNHRYSVKTTYMKDDLYSELLLIRRANRSTTNATDGYEAEWNSNVKFWTKFQLDYQLTYEWSTQKPKQANTAPETESMKNIQNLTLGYLFHPNWTVSTGVGINQVGNTLSYYGETSETISQTSSYNLALYYQGEENQLFNTEAGWELKSKSTLCTLNNQLTYPLWGGLIDHYSKIEMNWEQKEVYQYQFNLDYQFPTVFQVTPELGYQRDYVWVEKNQGVIDIPAKKEQKEALHVTLKYNWHENRGIFLEGKREILNSWSEPNSSFTSLGIFTGVEISY